MRSLRLDMNSPPSGASLRNQQNKSSINEEPVQFTLQKQPQGLQVLPGQVVCWERFLPLRTLKVLLVENDDSTRHVVSALLRNCSYEVTAVANGVEAWKVLEDLSNRIDLVLTEVDMPSLSGIGLLSKITNHRTCSNIPVIMMSSNDSMGVVFTCLSKGATDFLVKPIRKNELKNLWQHVWRKCHSSSGSGSGSESGIRTQKSTKSKSVEGSKNDLESNDEDDNGSFGLNARDGSDNGSGTQTQSCWSKRALEIESPQEMSPWDEQSDPTNSTNAQVNQSSSEMLQNNNQADTRKRQKLDNQHDKAAMSKDKESKGKTDVIMGGTEKEKSINLESEGDRKKVEKEKIDLNHEAPIELLNSSLEPDLDPEGTTTDLTTLQVENVSKQGPSLELTLKQTGDVSLKLRHSGISAFSRYNKSNVTTTNLAPTGSCSPVDKSPEAGKIDNLISNSSGAPNARSNGSSNNNDMGSTTNPEKVVADRSIIPKSTVNNINANLTLQPVTESPTPNANNQKIQVQHHHHHYHHHHHHVHNMQQQQQQQQINGEGLSTMEDIIAKDPNRVQSENVFAVNAEGNANNYGSASGSNNGSDQNGSSGKNGSSTAIDATEGINVTSDNGEAGQTAPGIVIGRSVADQNRIAWREAALNKFQQKRKERCFEKKVRYQSRKKLAEQRPRVRGQFVRQTADENKRSEKTNDADR